MLYSIFFEAAAPHPLNSLICWTKIWCACMFMSDDFTKWLLPLDLPGGVAAWHRYIKYMKVATQFLCHSFKWQMENCCCTTIPSLILPGDFLCPGNMPIHFGNVHIRGPDNFPQLYRRFFQSINRGKKLIYLKKSTTIFGTCFEAKEIQKCCFDMAPEMWHILYEIHSEIRDVDASSVAEGRRPVHPWIDSGERMADGEGIFFARHERVHFQRGFPKNVVNNS